MGIEWKRSAGSTRSEAAIEASDGREEAAWGGGGDASEGYANRLRAGDVLGGRYRVVAALGKGGMGEVFRADDLVLGSSVALKFLPPGLAADGVRLSRFRSEVRLTRQITHSNVCRVYDISEYTDGRTGEARVFLSMEYVDGEDLSSLLRRIGRLPGDKAVQIARQLCMGLAAAHEQGVLHRDLKPANIMVDGRGNARIMDFGIAGAAEDIAREGGAGAGTPAYMSPEQLSGREVSKRSDIYALGLVLHELFTGKRAHDAATVGELRRMRESSRPDSLSSLVRDLDPAAEAIILRCLEPDPAKRPASAVAVAAALPGADPLAAALAAGETPSPELIAASGGSARWSWRRALAWAGAAALGVSVFVVVTGQKSLLAKVTPEKTMPVLRDRAMEALRSLGHGSADAQRAEGCEFRGDFLAFVGGKLASPPFPAGPAEEARADRLRQRPGPYLYWMRTTPTEWAPTHFNRGVSASVPFPSTPGEVTMVLDGAGRVETLLVVPPRGRAGAARPGGGSGGDAGVAPSARSDETTEPRAASRPVGTGGFPEPRMAPASDDDGYIAAAPGEEFWAAALELAALDLGLMKAIEPVRRPAVSVDELRAWSGATPEVPGETILVHAGRVGARLVYLNVDYAWEAPPSVSVATRAERSMLVEVAGGGALLLILGVCGTLAVRNLRSGRGDRIGAMKAGTFVACAAGLASAVKSDTALSIRSVFFDGDVLASGLWVGMLLWFFYMALEPLARRVLPESLISWSRVLRGRFGDPLVGRHVLVGAATGSCGAVVVALFAALPHVLSRESLMPSPGFRSAVHLGGVRSVIAEQAGVLVGGMMWAAGTMLILTVSLAVLRLRWAAYTALVAMCVMIIAPELSRNPVDGLLQLGVGLIPILALARSGLLACIVAYSVTFTASLLCVGTDWGSAWTGGSIVPALVLAGTLAWGFFAATRGRASAG